MRTKARHMATATVIFIAVAVVLPGCAGPSAPAIIPAAVGAPTEKAVFRVAQLAINPPEVNPGVTALITARVTNAGDTAEEYVAELTLVDVAKPRWPAYYYSDRVTLGPRESQLVSVAVSVTNPGTYEVGWGGIKGTLTVVRPAEEPSSPQVSPSNLTTAPDFTAVDVVTGKKISLSDYKGTVVLLNFVNYGCSPELNRTVSSQLLAIKELTARRNDFVPVSVFCGCCPPEVLREFAQENALTWPWILDTDNSIVGKYARHLRKYGYPTLVFVDKDQVIREVSGYGDVTAINTKIDKILQRAQ